MTGSASDPTDGQPHIRNKAPREGLATGVRDTDDPLQVVLVHDMAHGEGDAPSLHTMVAFFRACEPSARTGQPLRAPLHG